MIMRFLIHFIPGWNICVDWCYFWITYFNNVHNVFRYWNTKRKIVFEWDDGLLMGFQAWLGATVVSVLQPVQITIHMLMALVILALMVYLISEVPDSSIEKHIIFDKRLNQL